MFKDTALGTCTVSIEELRGCPKAPDYLLVQHGFETRRTGALDKQQQHSSKDKKDSSDQQSPRLNETFSIPILSLQTDLEVQCVVRRLLGKDKAVAHVKVPLATLLDAAPHRQWWPLTKPPSAKHHGANKPTAAAQPRGEVRLTLQFSPKAPPAQRSFNGVTAEGEWTVETSGGTLMQHSSWNANPQFLLRLAAGDAGGGRVGIRLLQGTRAAAAEAREQRQVSFYVLRYGTHWDGQRLQQPTAPGSIEGSDGGAAAAAAGIAGLWAGRRKVVFNESEIVKFEDFWAPVFALEASAVRQLEAGGSYVIVPCTDQPGQTGRFVLDVWRDGPVDKTAGLRLDPLPLAGAGDWLHQAVSGEWCGVSGAGDLVNGTAWRANRQWLLKVHDSDEPLDVCLVLGQPEKLLSSGLYVLPYPVGYQGRPLVRYTHGSELAKTDRFRFLTSHGLAGLSLQPRTDYVVVPVSGSDKIGPFTLDVFSSGALTIKPATLDWHCSTLDCSWDEETAAGSPNHGKFASNPQIALVRKEPARSQCIVEVSVLDTNHAIGFIIYRSEGEHLQRLTEREVNDEELIFNRVEGWAAEYRVSSAFTIPASLTSPIVLIASTFDPDVTKRFKVTVYSDQPVELQLL